MDKYEKEFKEAIGRMLDMGMTEDEIGEVILRTFNETISEDKFKSNSKKIKSAANNDGRF